MQKGRWETVTDSEFPHERRGLDATRAERPDGAPWHAWSNFTFTGNTGHVREVDLLVVALSHRALAACVIHLMPHGEGGATGRGGRPCGRSNGRRWPASPMPPGALRSSPPRFGDTGPLPPRATT